MPAPIPATVHAAAQKVVPRSSAQVLRKSSSTDSLEYASQIAAKNALQCKPLYAVRAQLKRSAPVVAENTRHISRLELLLAPKRPGPVYTPVEDTNLSQEVNKAIKLSAQWTDVQKAVTQATCLSASNAAYGLYRLGCLYSFASKKRKQDMMQSGLVSTLLSAAEDSIPSMDPGSVTLLLDGCARIGQQPSPELLDRLAALVGKLALSLEATQLPLVLWAWMKLGYKPRTSVLIVLDNAAERLAPGMCPQGITLTLSGFRAAKHKPSGKTLTRLAETLHRKLALFKPSELADCLDAFSFFGYKPAAQVIQAIAQQSGRSVHSNIVVGKRSLTAQAALSTAKIDGLIEKHARFVEEGSKAAANGIAAAGRMLQQVSLKVGEMDDALNVQPGQRDMARRYRHI